MDAGLLVIDKPAGWTSRDCINRLERLARGVKFGHAGTLDPLATGVLLVAVSNATRLVEYLHELSKSYSAEFELGKNSPTLDCDSEVTLLADAPVPTREALHQEAAKWIGEVDQVPPQFSAIKVKGKRAYDLARKGTEVELAARKVRIDRIEITRYDYPQLEFNMDCGSGTYVRSLGRDLAAGLHTSAIMTKLVRTRIGPFHLSSALPMSHFESRETIEAALLPPATALSHWPQVLLSEEQYHLVDHGRWLERDGLQWREPVATETSLSECVNASKHIAAIAPDGRLAAILEPAEASDANYLRPKRVFHAIEAVSQPTANKTKHKPES